LRFLGLAAVFGFVLLVVGLAGFALEARAVFFLGAEVPGAVPFDCAARRFFLVGVATGADVLAGDSAVAFSAGRRLVLPLRLPR
jgi:hypothetical protein